MKHIVSLLGCSFVLARGIIPICCHLQPYSHKKSHNLKISYRTEPVHKRAHVVAVVAGTPACFKHGLLYRE